jgi:hypothetical protein
MIDPLLAAIEDWLRFIVPAALLLYAIIQMLVAKGNPQPNRKPQPRRVPERGLNPPQPQGKPVSPQQSQLNAEIEQFLKRAGERRDRTRKESPPPVKTAPKAPPRTLVTPPAEPRATTTPPKARDISTVAASVEKHLGGRRFEERAEHLADDIVRADLLMEEHVKSAFGHRLGTLGDPAVAPPAAPVTDVAPTINTPSAADNLAALLANPQNIRHAIILNEILSPPRHRW